MKMSDLMLLSACQDLKSTGGLIDRKGRQNLLKGKTIECSRQRAELRSDCRVSDVLIEGFEGW